MNGRVAGRRKDLRVLVAVFAAILLLVAIVAVVGGESSGGAGNGVCIADDAAAKYADGTLADEKVFEGTDCVEGLQPVP